MQKTREAAPKTKDVVDQLYALGVKTMDDFEIAGKYYEEKRAGEEEGEITAMDIEALETCLGIVKNYVKKSDELFNGMTIEKRFQLKRAMDEVLDRAKKVCIKVLGSVSEENGVDIAVLKKSKEFTQYELDMVQVAETEIAVRQSVLQMESELQLAKSMIAMGGFLKGLGEGLGSGDKDAEPSSDSIR